MTTTYAFIIGWGRQGKTSFYYTGQEWGPSYTLDPFTANRYNTRDAAEAEIAKHQYMGAMPNARVYKLKITYEIVSS